MRVVCAETGTVPVPAVEKRYSGKEIKYLMRVHRVTIRELARRMNITMARVAKVRENGISGNAFCLDWLEAIAGIGDFAVPPIH